MLPHPGAISMHQPHPPQQMVHHPLMLPYPTAHHHHPGRSSPQPQQVINVVYAMQDNVQDNGLAFDKRRPLPFTGSGHKSHESDGVPALLRAVGMPSTTPRYSPAATVPSAATPVQESRSDVRHPNQKRGKINCYSPQPADAQQEAAAMRPQRQLQRHCHICMETFAKRSVLKMHLRQHSGLSPFTCGKCGKDFAEKNSLTVHMRVHTGVRPFKCGVCGKCFAQQGNLTVHRRTHTGERPHLCRTCGKSFSERSTLTKHERIHSGDRPCVCHLCPKAFTVQSHLKAHMRTHTGERPFICHVCNRGFTAHGSLSRHLRIHTGESEAPSPAE